MSTNGLKTLGAGAEAGGGAGGGAFSVDAGGLLNTLNPGCEKTLFSDWGGGGANLGSSTKMSFRERTRSNGGAAGVKTLGRVLGSS